ncbi:MAG: hypothetical protein RIG63_29600 [Coleofasciculus chthonoplastes F3-SA18-01]
MARLYNGAERPNRCVYCYSCETIRINLSSTPHPQPLSHAGERGARAIP